MLQVEKTVEGSIIKQTLEKLDKLMSQISTHACLTDWSIDWLIDWLID